MVRETQRPIFVISSGRAGSTLLARMIQRHPDLLCVSDLFEPVGKEPYFDRATRIDGREFFATLSRPSLPQRIDYWRKQPTGELLFLHPDDEMVSLLTSYALPFLDVDDPMALFSELQNAVELFDVDAPANHLVRTFDWLRDRFGCQLWVERTGGSLPHAEKIVQTWPEAKIVHNYRDCRETAISMMTGSFFRLYLELEKNPELGEWDSDHMPPIEEMGSMLNRWIVDAAPALESVPADRRLDLAFEDLCAKPEAVLLGLTEFLLERPASAQDRDWAQRQAARIKPPPSRFADLPPEEQLRLEQACGDALDTLGYRPSALAFS